MENKKEIFKALFNFQQDAPIIHKGTEGYGYTYADLATVITTINPLLKKHNLGYTQLIRDNSLKTILFHIPSAQTLESDVEINQDIQLAKMNPFQTLGAAISYLRRYSLSSILGLVTDKDIDAAGKPIEPQNIVKNTASISNEDLKKITGEMGLVETLDDLTALKKKHKSLVESNLQVKQLFLGKYNQLQNA